MDVPSTSHSMDLGILQITSVDLEHQLAVSDNPTLNFNNIEVELALLREWNGRMTHIPRILMNDLAYFHISNSCDLDDTKDNINNYFLMRHYVPEMFGNGQELDSPAFKKFLDSVFVAILPDITIHYFKIVLAWVKNPAEWNLQYFLQLINMVIDVGIYIHGPDNKYLFVFDLKGTTKEICNSLDHDLLKKFFDYMRKGCPIKWNGVHYINTGETNFSEFSEKLTEYDNQLIKFHSSVLVLEVATGVADWMFPFEIGGITGFAEDIQAEQMQMLRSNQAVLYSLWVRSKLNHTNIATKEQVFGNEGAFQP